MHNKPRPTRRPVYLSETMHRLVRIEAATRGKSVGAYTEEILQGVFARGAQMAAKKLANRSEVAP